MLILTLETHAPKGHIHIYDERMSFPVHSHRTRNKKIQSEHFIFVIIDSETIQNQCQWKHHTESFHHDRYFN